MKKMTNLLFFLLIAVNIFSIETTASSIIFKDITKEHWAYKSIENLSQKGILNINRDIFNGEKGINRFDMAFYLSKTLDRVEQDKADREAGWNNTGGNGSNILTGIQFRRNMPHQESQDHD